MIGPHFAAAVVARRAGAGAETAFEFAITHDRQLAVDCGRALMGRVPPTEG